MKKHSTNFLNNILVNSYVPFVSHSNLGTFVGVNKMSILCLFCSSLQCVHLWVNSRWQGVGANSILTVLRLAMPSCGQPALPDVPVQLWTSATRPLGDGRGSGALPRPNMVQGNATCLTLTVTAVWPTLEEADTEFPATTVNYNANANYIVQLVKII